MNSYFVEKGRHSIVSGSLYTPSRNLSIDGSVVVLKGKHFLKQYMPAKWGFKGFVLCEFGTGYCKRRFFCDGDKGINSKPFNIVQCGRFSSTLRKQNRERWDQKEFRIPRMIKNYREKWADFTCWIRDLSSIVKTILSRNGGEPVCMYP